MLLAKEKHLPHWIYSKNDCSLFSTTKIKSSPLLLLYHQLIYPFHRDVQVHNHIMLDIVLNLNRKRLSIIFVLFIKCSNQQISFHWKQLLLAIRLLH
jgi:hypothetical protein